MNKKGFTLTELIGVITVLAILITFASINIFKYIKESRQKVSDIAIKNIEDSALSYANKNIFIEDKCAINTIVDDSNISSITMPSGCSKKYVTVSTLINESYFTDNKGSCNTSKKVLVYKYYYDNYDNVLKTSKRIYETKAYVPSDTCKN